VVSFTLRPLYSREREAGIHQIDWWLKDGLEAVTKKIVAPLGI
jgi:hypothetical protein